MGARTLYDAVDPLDLLVEDNRRQSGPGRPDMTGTQVAEVVLQISPKRIEDRTLVDQARTLYADLTGITVDAHRHATGGLLQIRNLGEHPLQTLAAELEEHRLKSELRAVGHNARAGGGGAGEGHLVDPRATAKVSPVIRPAPCTT